MSVERVRAFAVRLMSDEEFRGKQAKVSAEAEIEVLLTGYSFSWGLDKNVGVFMGYKLAAGELGKRVGEAFDGMGTGSDSAAVIAGWLGKK